MKIKENKKCYFKKSQREVLLNLIEIKIIEESFFLTGGTALSVFYLHHRKSNDLDFFTIQSIDISEIDFLLKTQLMGRYKKIKDSSTFLSLLIDNVKVDFVIDKLSNNKNRELISLEEGKNLFIDNINNIVSNKFCTIVSRTEPKDFIDFYYINKKIKLDSIEQIYNNARKKEAIFDDPPTAAFQLEENFKFIIKNQEIFPKILIGFDKEDFREFYNNLINWIYKKITSK